MPNERVDVLIVVAQPEEFGAVRAVGTALGVAGWMEGRAAVAGRFLLGQVPLLGGRVLSVALARPTRPGGRTMGPFVTGLLDALDAPRVAVCGVCAGNPDSTEPGDVVVAEVAYEWDEGEQHPTGFTADQRQFPLHAGWLRAAQDLQPTWLASHGRASAREAKFWLLDRLERGRDPRTSPGRGRYLPEPGDWKTALRELEADGLITRAGGAVLAPRGRNEVLRQRYDDVDGPTRLPFAVHVGPMASGSAVIGDATIWERLRAMGVRTVAAVETDAATVATLAHERELPWLVVKGVTDHADAHKDDRYRAFAARASAEVLFALLTEVLPAGPARRGSGGAGARDPWPGDVLDALMAVDELVDGPSRRRVVAELSPNIRGGIDDGGPARIQVLAIIRTCARYGDRGRDALIGALRATTDEERPDVRRALDAITRHWPPS